MSTRIKFLPVLALFLAAHPTVDAQAAPTLTQVERVQTSVPAYGHPKLIRDSQGKPIFVTLSEITGDKYNLNLTAYGAGGTKLTEMTVSRPQGQHEVLGIQDAALNGRGEIVVITAVFNDGTIDSRLYSDNLTTRKSVEISSVGRFASFEGRITYQGRNLVAVTSDLGHGENGTNPTLIRIVDEDTGDVIRHHLLNYSASGKLGVDRLGRLKLLLTGYEIFGVLDVASNQFRELIPPRHVPSQYPSEVELSIGTFMQFNDGNELQLLNIQDLMNGRLNVAHRYPVRTEFLVDSLYAASYLDDGILLTDPATGKALGPKIQKQGHTHRSGAAVMDVLVRGDQAVAVLSEPLIPNSYLQGTILTYIDVKTGAVLRTRKVQYERATSKLIASADGRIIGVEQIEFAAQKPDLRVVEVLTNKVLNLQTEIDTIGRPFRSMNGKLLSIRVSKQNELCVFDLLDFAQEACIQDTLIHGATRYGYSPREISRGRLILPLLGQRNGYNYSSFGFAEFKVE